MKVSKRVIQYANEHYNEVLHTTLDPEGPGCVRIHLIPPKFDPQSQELESSIAIINGMDIVPVNTSWSVLLAELIIQVNKYEGREVSEEDVQNILNTTAANVKKVYPIISKNRLKKDAYTIMSTLSKIAYGEEVQEGIAYLGMGEYAEQMQAPHRMDLMVSAMTKNGQWHCNQKCVHCYAAGQNLSEEEELSTEEWKAIIRKCREVMIPQVTFTGGEPTMRDDLVELIDSAKWFVTRLNTNGIKLTKEYCQKLKEVSLDSAQITFYSYDEAIHNKLVGASQYQNTLNGIKNAIECGLNISVNTPLCTLNKDYPETLAFLGDLGVRYVTCSGLITTGNATLESSENLQLSGEEMKEILIKSLKVCREKSMELSFTSPGWIENEFFKMYGLSTPSCGACLSNMAITPGGNIVPCQSWLSDEPLGNMLKDNWEEVWNNERCKEKRSFSAKTLGQCPLRRYHEN